MLSQRPVVEGSCEEDREVREEVWQRRRSWGEVTTIDPCCNMRLVILFTFLISENCDNTKDRSKMAQKSSFNTQGGSKFFI